MRILTFLHSFEPGGVERDALRLNDEWARLGADVQIVLGRRDGRLADEAPDLPYTVLERGRLSTASFETLWMIAKLPAVIRALRPDALFCAGNTYSIVAVAMRLILGRACPPIVLRVSNDLRRLDRTGAFRLVYRRWLRLQAPAFAAIVAMADALAPEIATEMNVEPARIAIINNGSIRSREAAVLAQLRDTTPRGVGRQFVAIGRLVVQKNFTMLVRAFASVAQADDRLTIIGEGGQRARLEQLAQKLDLNDQVSLPGHVNPVGSFLATADAYILSSDYEGLPAVIVEALAAAVPIVATNCCVSMPMLVKNAGLLVPIKNAAALARAMEQISGVATDPAAMRARARGFAVETVAPEWLTLFAELSA